MKSEVSVSTGMRKVNLNEGFWQVYVYKITRDLA